MTKTLDTLVEDIYEVVSGEHTFNQENVDTFGKRLAEQIKSKLSREHTTPKLWMSNFGQPCERKLWYSIRKPELAEPLKPEVFMKFLFGDILEELLLFLAKEAGHTVEAEQERVAINGVSGRIDAIIDGTLVDVKSASSYSFGKFRGHLEPEEDAFGYLGQLNAYLAASFDDPRLTEKDTAAFLAIDKTLGHICIDKHAANGKNYHEEIEHKKEVVSREEAPERAYTDQAEGKSGNRKLGTACSYCPFKKECWPGLRTFFYSNGPTFLTHVEKLPKVPELVE
jgi:hypothetical protein